MGRIRHTTASLVLLLATLVAACGGGSPAARQPTAPRVAAQAQDTQAPAPPPTSEPPALPTDAPEPTATPVEEKPTTAPRVNNRPRGGVVPRPRATNTPTPEPTNTPTPVPTDAPSPTPTPEVGEPVRFRINTDDVKVDAAVEHVAKTEDGAMDVPKKWEDVAWFEPGYEPGKKGNAVIAGHFDTDDRDNPYAVFYYLDKIDIGDEVSIEDEKGKVLRFRVNKVETYNADDAPIYEIFGPSNKARLNLITCDGTWDRDAKAYDKRLVVFTELIEG